VSFKSFNLDARLMTSIARASYTEPTPIQKAAIPVALSGRDLIGTAQTGTGKTAAFVLPILQRLLHGPRNQARALVITPTRELAEQINDTFKALAVAFKALAVGTSLRSATIYGGVGQAPQIRALRDGVEVLVVCPGRLLDLIDQRYAKLTAIEVLVLDEADRMFDMGFLPSVRKILKHLPSRRQTMLFSATFPREVEELATRGRRARRPDAASPRAHRGRSGEARAHGHACALPGGVASQDRAAPGAAQTDRHRLGLDLYPDQASRTASGAADRA